MNMTVQEIHDEVNVASDMIYDNLKAMNDANISYAGASTAMIAASARMLASGIARSGMSEIETKTGKEIAVRAFSDMFDKEYAEIKVEMALEQATGQVAEKATA